MWLLGGCGRRVAELAGAAGCIWGRRLMGGTGGRRAVESGAGSLSPATLLALSLSSNPPRPAPALRPLRQVNIAVRDAELSDVEGTDIFLKVSDAYWNKVGGQGWVGRRAQSQHSAEQHSMVAQHGSAV